MQRRKFVIGMGSLAAGSAAAVGTGAFNFANVERDTNINVATDSNAFLGLTTTSDYANTDGDKLTITLNDNATSENYDNGDVGSGINEDSDYSFRSVFEITNQGANPVGVWLEDNDNDVVQWYAAGSDFSNSIEDPENAYALNPGESVAVSMEVLLRDKSESDLPNNVNIKADKSQGN